MRLTERALPTTTVRGEPVTPVLAATGLAWAGFEIDRAHVEVIDRARSSSAAARSAAGRWTGAETQLAELARTFTPDVLAVLAQELIDALDEDGAEPDHDSDTQINELFLTPSAEGMGGRPKGRLDSSTFDASRLAIDGVIKPDADDGKPLGAASSRGAGRIV